MSGSIGELITLGTVQFGLPYGIANRAGCPSDEEIMSILKTASSGGITRLDTARSYGTSEARLGHLLPDVDENWRITTKIVDLEQMFESHQCRTFSDAAARSLRLSLEALRRDSVDLVLFHRSRDAWRPGVLERLEQEREHGRFNDLGVSVYDPDEAVECMKDPRISHIQLPLNFLDGRWFGGTFEHTLAHRKDVTIHARSAFLQGLLLHGAAIWPKWVAAQAREIDVMLTEVSRELEVGRIDLCLRYVASVPWVNRIVVGVDSATQLHQILSIRFSEPLPADMLRKLKTAASLAPKRLLNPSLW